MVNNPDLTSLQKQLRQGCEQLGLSLTEQQQQLMLQYLQLLIKWNKAYNLTAVREPQAMVNLHLLDSLALLPYLPKASARQQWLDVGTGAGLPGIVLAIMYPQHQLHLLDSNGKKTRFLQQVVHELSLANVVIYHQRLEQLQKPAFFDAIFSRAFSELQTMINWCGNLLQADGHYYAMKGQQPQQELQALPVSIQLQACHNLQVPGVDAQRHLIVLAPQDPTGKTTKAE